MSPPSAWGGRTPHESAPDPVATAPRSRTRAHTSGCWPRCGPVAYDICFCGCVVSQVHHLQCWTQSSAASTRQTKPSSTPMPYLHVQDVARAAHLCWMQEAVPAQPHAEVSTASVGPSPFGEASRRSGGRPTCGKVVSSSQASISMHNHVSQMFLPGGLLTRCMKAHSGVTKPAVPSSPASVNAKSVSGDSSSAVFLNSSRRAGVLRDPRNWTSGRRSAHRSVFLTSQTFGCRRQFMQVGRSAWCRSHQTLSACAAGRHTRWCAGSRWYGQCGIR